MKKITLGMAVFLACSYSAAQRSSSSSSSDLLVAAAFGVAVGSLLSANNGVDNQDALIRDAKAKLEEAELQGSVQVLAAKYPTEYAQFCRKTVAEIKKIRQSEKFKKVDAGSTEENFVLSLSNSAQADLKVLKVVKANPGMYQKAKDALTYGIYLSIKYSDIYFKSQDTVHSCRLQITDESQPNDKYFVLGCWDEKSNPVHKFADVKLYERSIYTTKVVIVTLPYGNIAQVERSGFTSIDKYVLKLNIFSQTEDVIRSRIREMDRNLSFSQGYRIARGFTDEKVSCM